MALTVEELQIKLGCDASQAQEVLDKMNATVKAYTDKFQKYFQTKSGNVKPLSTVAKQIDKEAKNIESANKRLSKASRDTDMMLARIRSAVNRQGTEYFPSGKKYVGGDANGRGGFGSMGDPNYFKNSKAYKMTFGGRKPNNELIEFAAQLRAAIEESLGSVESLSKAMRMKIGDSLIKLRDLSKQYQEAVREHGVKSPQASAAEAKFKAAIYAADKYAQQLSKVVAKEREVNEQESGSVVQTQSRWQSFISSVKSGASVAYSSLRKVHTSIKKAFNHTLLGRFWNRLKMVTMRMAAMKLIRGTIQGVQKGLEELAKHSESSAKAMNTIKAAGGSIKMALGAAVMPIVKALAPLFVQLAGAISSAANAIARFFAVITGQSTYTAVTFSDSLDGISSSASGAGKAVKGMLASFDEINLITSQSGGGGGGSTGVESSLSTVSDQLAFSDLASTLREKILGGDWEGVGSTLAEQLGTVAQKFTAFLQRPEIQNFGINLAETINGVVSDESNWYKVGEAIGTAIGTVTKWICDFFDNVDWPQVWASIKAFVKGVKDGIEKEVGDQFDYDKPYWEIINEKLFPKNYQIDFDNPFEGINEDLERMWEDTKLNAELTVTALVELARSGWTTVSEWVNKYGKSPAEALVKLVKKGWTTVYEWVKKYTGATYSKAVQLARSGWATVAEWVNKYAGAAVTKGVGLLRSGWTTVANWINQSWLGGVVSKSVSLTVNLANNVWNSFLTAWNNLKSKTLELKVGINDRLRSAWNTAASKWNGSFILSALGRLPYLASGGIAYGQTAAIIGEYSGAKSNPEVVAPLSDLTRILSNVSLNGGKDTMTREQANTMIRLLQRIEQKENVIQPSVGLGQVVQRSLDAYARV